MLEHDSVSRLSYLIIIGFLGCVIVFLGYKVGLYEGDIRTANIIKNWTAGENKELKQLNEKYVQALQSYQAYVNSGYRCSQDSTIQVKKGTLVIPPMQLGDET